MSDDARRVLKEARMTLSRLEGVEEGFASGHRGSADSDPLSAWVDRMPNGSPSSTERPDRPRPSFSWEQVKQAIDAAILEERERTRDILIGLVEGLREESADDMATALKSLAIEVTDLRATVAELRLALCDVRQKQPLDLPDGFRAGKAAN